MLDPNRNPRPAYVRKPDIAPKGNGKFNPEGLV